MSIDPIYWQAIAEKTMNKVQFKVFPLKTEKMIKLMLFSFTEPCFSRPHRNLTRWDVVDVEVSRDDGERGSFSGLQGSFLEVAELRLNFGHGLADEILLALVGHHVQVADVADTLSAVLPWKLV